MYSLVLLSIWAAALGSVAWSAEAAFIVNSSKRKRSITTPVAAGGRIRHRASIHSSRGAPLFQTEFDGDDGEDVFVLSFDGTLASTDRARSWMAVSAALKVWPTLRSTMRGLGMDPDHFDDRPEDRVEGSEAADAGGRTPHEWLIRKLSALSSVAQQGDCPDAMLGCDSVLLARLLLEEQSLDGGRSNGRGGKYGGKFHPSNSNPGDDGEGEERSRTGSRPLTVGEIYANWGELRDVTRMRYPRVAEIDGKTKRQDPLPEIRRRLKELFSAAAATEEGRDGTTLVPSWRPLAYDVLFDCHDGGADPRRNAVILLGHEAQLPWALTVLSSLGREATVTTSEGALERYDARIQGSRGEEGDAEPSWLVVVPDSAREESHSKMIERIVDEFGGKSGKESNRNVFVTHSSLEVLKRCKSFLGDDAPILSEGLRKCSLPNTNMAVTLFLPEWAENVHPSQQNEGEMDPWLNLVREEQFLEQISGRIIAPSMA